MSTNDFERFEQETAKDRRELFEVVAQMRSIRPAYVEKDYWVCRVLSVMMREKPFRPKCYFKGGTSLSKGFDLIHRFSEDIDIVFSRDGLGFGGEDDPTDLTRQLSKKQRKKALDALTRASADHMRGPLKSKLEKSIQNCQVITEGDADNSTVVLVKYQSVFAKPDEYVAAAVKVEGGARGALTPIVGRAVSPYINGSADGFDFQVPNISMISPKRTFLEKLVLIHSFNHKSDDAPALDANRVSRHFYDIAMMYKGRHASDALSDGELLTHVAKHCELVFSSSKARYDLAIPATLRLMPTEAVAKVLENDYAAMSGMMFDNPPTYKFVMEKVQSIEMQVRMMTAQNSFALVAAE
jgi:Nucleotidyl transferase AbiEii toxin, Type IV TA system